MHHKSKIISNSLENNVIDRISSKQNRLNILPGVSAYRQCQSYRSESSRTSNFCRSQIMSATQISNEKTPTI
jgi:hypothetical protein